MFGCGSAALCLFVAKNRMGVRAEILAKINDSAVQQCKNYQGFDPNLPRVYKRDGDVAVAPEILALFRGKNSVAWWLGSTTECRLAAGHRHPAPDSREHKLTGNGGHRHTGQHRRRPAI